MFDPFELNEQDLLFSLGDADEVLMNFLLSNLMFVVFLKIYSILRYLC